MIIFYLVYMYMSCKLNDRKMHSQVHVTLGMHLSLQGKLNDRNNDSQAHVTFQT